MSSPFGDIRPGGSGADGGSSGADGRSSGADGGRSGANDGISGHTEQWEPIDGEAWSNAPGAYDGSGWGTPAAGYSYSGGVQPSQGGYGAPASYPGGYPGGLPGPYSPQQQPGGTGGSGGGKVALIILAALLLVAAGGAVGYFLVAGRGDDGGGGNPTQPTAAPTQSRPTEAPTRDRAEGFVAPASWNKCGGSGEPGDLNLYYSGTSVTSCSFTKAVRDAFVDRYNATDQLEGTISAYSPVTRQTYAMNCTDDGDYVTCRGGNNAVVHIV